MNPGVVGLGYLSLSIKHIDAAEQVFDGEFLCERILASREDWLNRTCLRVLDR